jgi:hypothetical protein
MGGSLFGADQVLDLPADGVLEHRDVGRTRDLLLRRLGEEKDGIREQANRVTSLVRISLMMQPSRGTRSRNGGCTGNGSSRNGRPARAGRLRRSQLWIGQPWPKERKLASCRQTALTCLSNVRFSLAPDRFPAPKCAEPQSNGADRQSGPTYRQSAPRPIDCSGCDPEKLGARIPLAPTSSELRSFRPTAPASRCSRPSPPPSSAPGHLPSPPPSLQ